MPVFKSSELAAWTGSTWSAPPPDALEGVSTDTRSLATGSLFVALQGPRHNGESYVEEAFKSGAAAAMVSLEYPESPHPLLRVSSTRDGLAALAVGYRDTVNAVRIGITGSVGKSTVKEMTAAMLSDLGPTARTCGNWNNDIGLPLSLLAMERDTRFGVFELGTNHPGEIAPLSRMLSPSWALITRIGPVHLEFFESVDAIVREKAQLLRGLPADGMSVLNRDDPYHTLLASMAPGPVCSFGTDEDADYMLMDLEPGSARMPVRERSTGDVVELPLPLPGGFQSQNAVAAVAVARGHGVGWDAIAEALRTFRPLAMRWEESTLRGVRFINDAYNANPVSMQACIRAFSEAYPGPKWLVLADMLELGTNAEAMHRDVGAFAASYDWQGLLVTGTLGTAIADGAEAAGMPTERVHHCDDVLEVADVVTACVEPGDAVLLKASRGMALERVVEAFDRECSNEEPG